MKISYKIIILTLSVCFGACVKDLDFNQAQELELEPAIAISLLNFDFSINDLSNYDSSVDQDLTLDEEIIEEVSFSTFEEPFFQEDLDRVAPEIEGSNTFDVDFTLKLTFYDENDNETYLSEEIVIPANSIGPYTIEEIVILNSPNVINTSRIEGNLKVQGTANPSEEKRIIINTGAIFYFSTN